MFIGFQHSMLIPIFGTILKYNFGNFLGKKNPKVSSDRNVEILGRGGVGHILCYRQVNGSDRKAIKKFNLIMNIRWPSNSKVGSYST